MKKMSKSVRNGLLNALVIIATIALVLYLGNKNGDIGDATRTMQSAKLEWLLMAAVAWIVFTIFETLGIHVFFIQQKIKIRFRSSLLVSLVGMFYSDVTPAATGGQPMQVVALRRRGVPSGVSCSALAVKFFCFQCSLLIMGLFLWITHPAIVGQCMNQACRVFVITGFILNSFTIVAVLLLAINGKFICGSMSWLIRVGHKLHLIRNVDRMQAKANKAINDFQASVDMVTHHPVKLMALLGVSTVQVLGLMSIAYCVYRALGQSAASYGEILTLQFLLYIGASFTPLPGASGAQEGGFYLLFGQVFPSDKILGALLLWRFYTYYLTLVVGLIAVIINSAGNIKSDIEEENEIHEETAQT